MAWHSPQYLKALRASFPPDHWPATELTEPDGTVLFVLKDGSEIHRIEPSTDVYDYDTGKLIGRVGTPATHANDVGAAVRPLQLVRVWSYFDEIDLGSIRPAKCRLNAPPIAGMAVK